MRTLVADDDYDRHALFARLAAVMRGATTLRRGQPVLVLSVQTVDGEVVRKSRMLDGFDARMFYQEFRSYLELLVREADPDTDVKVNASAESTWMTVHKKEAS
jgi:hypothetical protein